MTALWILIPTMFDALHYLFGSNPPVLQAHPDSLGRPLNTVPLSITKRIGRISIYLTYSSWHGLMVVDQSCFQSMLPVI